MTTIYIDGYVGYEVASIEEVVNAKNAGLMIIDAEGYSFGYEVEDEDGMRGPTDEEVTERIQDALKAKSGVYAAFYLDCGKVVREAATTLQSDYYVGQSVYILYDNQVMQATIDTIQIATTKSEICARYKTKNGLIVKSDRIGATLEELFEKMKKEIKK